MQIGAMNNPQRDPIAELRWMSRMGFQFVDLTLEPPAAASWEIDIAAVRSALREHEMSVVGHTAYYLPIASPFEGVRRAAVDEMKQCLEKFHQVGARLMNLHPDRYAPMHDRRFVIQQNIRSIRDLLPAAERLGITLMLENIPGDFNTPEQLAELLEPLPALGLHLDIGHANLGVIRNMAPDIIRAFGPRLRHVHLHDNKGGTADLHLPLGAGSLELAESLAALKKSGYDATITLEVFSSDPHYIEYSRATLERLWSAL